MRRLLTRDKSALWLGVFLPVSMLWLLAPVLNQQLSYRVTLISQYETAGQPYSLLFRLGDVAAGMLLLYITTRYARTASDKITYWLLMAIGIGMALDPILTTDCLISNKACTEPVTLHSILHGIETVMTATAFVLLTFRDAWQRRNLVSIVMVLFQVAYGLLFITKVSKAEHITTLTQYLYQCGVLLWLAWFCRDKFTEARPFRLTRRVGIVRLAVAVWAAINGVFAIVSSLTDINLLGRIDSIYFAGHTAWLAQHGVVVGVIMLYLSRHILRGEQRARQLFLVIISIEIFRYALITPILSLEMVYIAAFTLLFIARDDFQRGAVTLTWELRLKDLAYVVGGILVASLAALLLLDRDDRVARVTARTLNHFGDYVFTLTPPRTHHIESILLAHTITAFAVVSIGVILWILFRPARLAGSQGDQDRDTARSLLAAHSTSSEDYFKLWPADKHYFWSIKGSGFIAYKLVGPIAFALADPIAPTHKQQATLVQEFVTWTRQQRLRACFLLIFEDNLKLYESLNSVQIGSSALIDTEQFCETTVRDKWWRWKQNRARKQGYEYFKSTPPHNRQLLADIGDVSDSWLASGDHDERGFALGYFDIAYLQASVLHCVRDESGEVVAFVNELPACKALPTATIDLLRYKPSADEAMPFLLSQVITDVRECGYAKFDLGFVPFAGDTGQLLKIAATMSAGRFSAKGLEQFKNKFDPDWQPNYLAYDGDVGDLALIALNLEKAMRL